MNVKKISIFFFLFLFVSALSAQSLEDAPESAKLYNEGNKLRKSGNFEGAVAKYDEALKGSNDYRIYYQKGVTLKKLRKYKDAEASFIKCSEANPKFDIAYNGLGGTYFVTGDYKKAIESFTKFKELSKKQSLKDKANQYIARSYSKLGMNLKTDGNYDAAIKNLKSAVKHYPYDAAYLALAEVYVEKGQYDDAIKAADNAINNRKSISKGAAYYYKGLAFKGKKDKVKAKENFLIAKKDSKYRNSCKYELKMLNQ